MAIRPSGAVLWALAAAVIGLIIGGAAGTGGSTRQAADSGALARPLPARGAATVTVTRPAPVSTVVTTMTVLSTVRTTVTAGPAAKPAATPARKPTPRPAPSQATARKPRAKTAPPKPHGPSAAGHARSGQACPPGQSSCGRSGPDQD